MSKDLLKLIILLGITSTCGKPLAAPTPLTFAHREKIEGQVAQLPEGVTVELEQEK